MWQHRSTLLAPLTKLTSNSVPWKWTAEEQMAFDDMKLVMSRQTLIVYPDFSKPFHIFTDCSKLQLGAVIMQDGKPVAFYSRKLNPAQTRYTTTERELLSIVETLKEFRNILLGQQIIVHTDHENLTYKNFNSDRVMRWRLFIEEYSPDLKYIKGEENVVADALSRLPKELAKLPQDDTPLDNSKEAFYATMDCLTKDHQPFDFHPVSYAKLDAAQQVDPDIKLQVSY